MIEHKGTVMSIFGCKITEICALRLQEEPSGGFFHVLVVP
jgi:hypothetical protein